MSTAPPLLLRLPAHPSCLRAVRSRTLAWLTAAGWPGDEADHVVYAVSEAVSNAIEHAYRPEPHPPGRIPEVRIIGTVLGDATDGFRAEVRVRDRGRWRPPSAQPGHRGRGLAVMRSSLGSVTIRTGTAGTEIVLVSAPVARLSPGRVPDPSSPGAAPPSVADLLVAVSASSRTPARREAHRRVHRRVRLALVRAAEAQRRSADNRRRAEELVAAVLARRDATSRAAR